MDKRSTNRSLLGLLSLIIVFISFSPALSQGIKGKVTDTGGDPLPFASIIIVGTNHGIATNIEGDYILPLNPGNHRIRFQYLGYTVIDTSVQTGSSFTTFNVKMRPEVVALAEATVSGKGEDRPIRSCAAPSRKQNIMPCK